MRDLHVPHSLFCPLPPASHLSKVSSMACCFCCFIIIVCLCVCVWVFYQRLTIDHFLLFFFIFPANPFSSFRHFPPTRLRSRPMLIWPARLQPKHVATVANFVAPSMRWPVMPLGGRVPMCGWRRIYGTPNECTCTMCGVIVLLRPLMTGMYVGST